MRKRRIGIILTIVFLAMVCVLAVNCGAVPGSTGSTILGKWRHGLPEECPPSMDPRLYEELKKLPENQTYYWEFFKDGQVVHTDEEWICTGTYTLIEYKYIKITWDIWATPLIEALGGLVFEIQIFSDNMILTKGDDSITFWRVL